MYDHIDLWGVLECILANSLTDSERYNKRIVKRFEDIDIDEFKFQSYKKWSYMELYKYLIDNRDNNVVKNLENFINVMNERSCLENIGDSSFMFSTAADTALWIYDICLNGEQKGGD